ncbi:hypothetical protein B0J18DRAFT_435885 [Chaetomium sp. MPI-SDFR-AT-0129]|nr:hypothetical protein B0J18DRAFT_435885 [Chaetomium sp. MPI-SDFR-AT-0129]
MAAVDFESIANQFVEHYYLTFDSDRSRLGPLYRENSMLTFQRGQAAGVAKITEKLVDLPFKKVAHQTEAIDAQPCPTGGIFILVTGKLQADEDGQFRFSQAFQLFHDGNQWFVLNDVFQLGDKV